jgi:hypothetical protein
MSKKENKFKPSAGFVVAVHMNSLGIRAVAKELDVFAEELGEAMDRAGFQLIADPFNLTADATGLIKLQARHETEGLQVVKEPDNDDAGSDTSTD